MEERPAPVRSVIGHGVLFFVLVFLLSLALSLLGEAAVGRRVFLAGGSGLVLLCLWILFHIGQARIESREMREDAEAAKSPERLKRVFKKEAEHY